MSKTAAIAGIGIGVAAIYLGVTGYYQSAWLGLQGKCSAGDKGATVDTPTAGPGNVAGEASMDVPGDYYYIASSGAMFKSSGGLW